MQSLVCGLPMASVVCLFWFYKTSDQAFRVRFRFNSKGQFEPYFISRCAVALFSVFDAFDICAFCFAIRRIKIKKVITYGVCIFWLCPSKMF